MYNFTKYLQNFNTVSEDFIQNYKLNYITKFNVANLNHYKNCAKITLNFGFKEIKFEKKQMIIYFFLMELLTNQKCVLTTSSKNLITFKIKKGAVTGCKITLRNFFLEIFLETLLLGLPRSEIFKGLSFNTFTIKFSSYSTKIKNLFIFYALETEVLFNVESLDISFNFNTQSDLEKIFFFTSNKIPLQLF